MAKRSEPQERMGRVLSPCLRVLRPDSIFPHATLLINKCWTREAFGSRLIADVLFMRSTSKRPFPPWGQWGIARSPFFGQWGFSSLPLPVDYWPARRGDLYEPVAEKSRWLYCWKFNDSHPTEWQRKKEHRELRKAAQAWWFSYQILPARCQTGCLRQW